MATRADRCSYIPSVDTLFVSRKGLRGVFTRRRLFSESRSNLLVRPAMGTNMKIIESRECIDSEKADWGLLQTQRISDSQINTITIRSKSRRDK